MINLIIVILANIKNFLTNIGIYLIINLLIVFILNIVDDNFIQLSIIPAVVYTNTDTQKLEILKRIKIKAVFIVELTKRQENLMWVLLLIYLVDFAFIIL